MPAADAQTRAELALGDPQELAEELAAAQRRSSWFGRHGLVAFGLLPVVGFPVLWGLLLGGELWLICGLGFGWDEHKLHLVGDDPVRFRHWANVGYGADYVAIALGALLFCWLARRAGARWVWLGCACLICSALAGLRKDDFLVEVNHRPVTSLQAFRRTVDRSRPGTTLAVTAWRDKKLVEFSVPVGREKYKSGGYFSICFPTVVHQWDLWPNPGFSLVCVGFEPDPGLRHELAVTAKPPEVYNEEWKAYLAFVEVSKGQRVVAEEPVTVSPPLK